MGEVGCIETHSYIRLQIYKKTMKERNKFTKKPHFQGWKCGFSKYL